MSGWGYCPTSWCLGACFLIHKQTLREDPVKGCFWPILAFRCGLHAPHSKTVCGYDSPSESNLGYGRYTPRTGHSRVDAHLGPSRWQFRYCSRNGL